MGSDWQDELNSGGGVGYYKPGKEIKIGETGEVVIVDATKITKGDPNTDLMKYWTLPKTGKPYLWRFRLADSRTWDVTNNTRKTILAGLHPKGEEKIIPGRFRITNIGMVINKQPAIKVDYLGLADSGAVVV